MPCATLQEYLEENDVEYEVIPHSEAYTAQETAAEVHTHGWEVAKPTMLVADDELIMAVLTAPAYVDLVRMQSITGADEVRLAAEHEFEGIFDDCESGAEPPFGNLYGLETYIDEELATNDTITFDAGTHNEVVRMSMDDFEDLCEGVWGRFSTTRRPEETELHAAETHPAAEETTTRGAELSPDDF